MIGIEVFSGAGGLSVGASMAGIEIIGAIEIDKYAADTFQKNHPNANVIVSDIRNVKELTFNEKKSEQKILLGGPPCQGFSRSNKINRTKENPNNWLFKEYLRFAKLWKPDWFVLENVQGLVDTEKGMFLEQILKGFKEIGYTTNFKILNAKDFGVPQNRERLFIVGSLHNEPFEFPEPTLSGNLITVKDALNDLPNLINGNPNIELNYKRNKPSEYAIALKGQLKKCSNNGVSRNQDYVLKRYEHIEQGQNWSSIPESLMGTYKDASRCHSGIYHRLDENKPSVVIGNYRKNMLIHPTQNRGLSVREAARLQSFPDSFKFHGSLDSQQQQVGNAVPPLLAKEVFKIISKK